jgi:hypothetical protein
MTEKSLERGKEIKEELLPTIERKIKYLERLHEPPEDIRVAITVAAPSQETVDFDFRLPIKLEFVRWESLLLNLKRERSLLIQEFEEL